MLIAFDEPRLFDSTSWMPAHSSTARTGPPAMTPVPALAGLSSTTPAASSPCTGCGMVAAIRGTLKKFFLASSTPLAMAAGTSLALPYPTPTVPSPSPTTTRAVKLNRRPPLTTLATRLMVTTRSTKAVFSPPSRSRRLSRSRRSRRAPLSPPPPPLVPAPVPPPRRWGPAIRRSFSLARSCSQAQAALTGAVGHRGHPAVVAVAAAVEDDRVDAGRAGPLRDALADLAGLRRLVAVEDAQVRLHRGGVGQGMALRVVDDLGHDVPGGTGDDEARALRRAGQALAHPQVPPLARGVRALARTAAAALDADRHFFLPAFPTLRRICSPAYRTPLPLYGSGLRSLRRLAAPSPTSCLSMPLTLNRVGASTRNVTPSGGSIVMGWL